MRVRRAPMAQERTVRKAADIEIGTDYDLQKSTPCWSFSLIDHAHSGLWDWNLTQEEYDTFLRFLREIQEQTWGEIFGQVANGHRKHHQMKTETLCREAKTRLAALNLGDQEEVFRFRLTGKIRLWGTFIGKRHEFYLLWWDRDHAIYPLDH